MITELTLDRMNSLRITTPEGVVYVSTVMGTHVMVYDDPEHNPVGVILLRRETE